VNLHTTLVGTWYEHAVLVPTGTKFKTGASATIPGGSQAVGFTTMLMSASLEPLWQQRIPAYLARQDDQHRKSESEGQTQSLLVTGVVSTGDAGDKAVLAPLSVAQKLSGHAGKSASFS